MNTPPFSITEAMLSTSLDIAAALTHLEIHSKHNLTLRKENRIKAIHSSLAIEHNSLSLEQVTAILEGKRVLGPPRDIREVENAYKAYDEILHVDPYNQDDFLHSHYLLTHGLIRQAGQYRTGDVGVFDRNGHVIHMGARPQFIASHMDDLFSWGRTSSTPELIKSCVFHYEIEMIHPFEDGNGRIGRLWQTVILARWNPLFAWIPVESIIHQHQQEYYDALATSDRENTSNCFIEFMLNILLTTLQEYSV